MTPKILSYKQLELANALEKVREDGIFAVIDVKVKNMLPQWLQFLPNVFWLQRPEEQKNIETYTEAMDFFLTQGIQRGNTLVAVGGGATTDFGGFVAATVHRGIKWIAVPTTLMGMVDAAIGGKTALNTKQGKNLIGAFHQPEEVWINTDFLKTLALPDMLSGKGELLKYGLLDRSIHDNIMSQKQGLIEPLIMPCALYKAGVVERDFKENGERAILNLGHTLGHGFEHTMRIPHGIAVALGMKYLFKAFGLNDSLMALRELALKMDFSEDKLDIANYPQFDAGDFWSAVGHDKKRQAAGIKLVLVDDVGKTRLELTPMVQLKQRLEALPEFKH